MSKTVAEQLDPIFKARSVAVIGASNNPTKWGYSLMERLTKGGYPGAIFPVNPNEDTVMGLPAYSSISKVPGPVDLAAFAIPAALVLGAMEEAIHAGIGGAVVVSAGFAETDEQGAALQRELVHIVRRGGIRMVGPNCNGLWSSAVGLSLSSPRPTRPGAIAFVSQSGAFGGMLASQAEEKGYGLSKFISSGNQADLNEADYLEYLAQDPDTRVITLYAEGFQDGRRFLEVARRVVRHKPIVIYKAGRNPVGARAMRSHTGSLMMPEDLFNGLCAQVGLIRAPETSHLFDMAEALAKVPLPPAPGVGIISMTGGQCVVSSDTCAHLGLEVPELDQKTQRYLKTHVLAPHAPVPRNPVDIAGDFRSPLVFAQAAEALARLDAIGLLLITPPSPRGGDSSTSEEAAQRIAAIPKEHGKPVLALGLAPSLNPTPSSVAAIFQEAGIPGYSRPEDAARAAYALVRYAQIQRQALRGDEAPWER